MIEPAEDDRGLRGLRGLVGRKGWRKALIRVFGVFRGSFQLSAFSFLLFLLAGALFWAKGRDPFQRVCFKVAVPGQGKVECIAVLPKMAARPLPVVVYLHGSGGSVLGSGNELRQMAEMGLAAVGMDYEEKAEGRMKKAEIDGSSTGEAFDGQFTGLLEYLQRQRWADTNRVAWVGYSLGAQRLLALALQHPERQPKLLVRLAGGWVPELDESEHPTSNLQRPTSNQAVLSTLNPHLSRRSPTKAEPLTSIHCPVLLMHAERDEVFPLAQAESVAACLRTNGVPVELRILPGEGHGLGGNRLLVFRVIGEQCLTRLKGPDAVSNYRSILSWQAQAKPLWLFWMPALVWAVVWLWLRRGVVVGQASRLPVDVQKRSSSTAFMSRVGAMNHGERTDPSPWPSPLRKGRGGVPGAACETEGPGASGEPKMGSRGRSPSRRAGGTTALPLRWLAAVLATAALGLTALHLVPPRMAVSDFTLSIARKHLVQAKEMSDFEYLAGQPVWRGKPLATLLEHVELAHYNRELINWKLEEQVYRDYVLSPQIAPGSDGGLNWRRALWENFYPRIRREQDPAAAAEIVVRFLRERVTITQGDGLSSAVAEIWQRQVINARGFEALYVAALRSVGVPARLAAQGRAEFCVGASWQPAPRPLVERWQ